MADAPAGADPDHEGLRMTLVAEGERVPRGGAARLVAILRHEGDGTVHVNGARDPPFALTARGADGDLLLPPNAPCGAWEPRAFPPGEEARLAWDWDGRWYGYLRDEAHPRAPSGDYVVTASALCHRTPDHLDRAKFAVATARAHLE